MPLFFLVLFGAGLLVWFIYGPRLVAWRRARLARRAFPGHWRRILRKNLPVYRQLPADLQLQLKQHIKVFLAEKAFVGCADLVLTEEMRVVIAAQACLLLLNRPVDYFPQVGRILVYPGAFVAQRSRADAAGVQHEWRETLVGESWSGGAGQIVLSWDDVLNDARHGQDSGRNVVLHEFAHQLDGEAGATNGAPAQATRRKLRRWSEVMNREYNALRWHIRLDRPRVLDDYAATNPAEFFAVSTETFFMRPHALREQHGELYQLLSDFYCVNPCSW